MSTRQRAVFFGHGSPMNTFEDNTVSRFWRSYGAGLERPRAILSVSAHWFINATAVTAMDRPRTIHDFFGFPPELFAFQYAAPGDRALAQEVVDLVAPTWIGFDEDSWGLDHGTWSVLAHVLPEADVPVVQLSVHAAQPLEYHVQLGRALAPLLERDVMIMASGNVVHHLGMLDWSQPEAGFDWARRFDDEAARLMTTDPEQILELAEHRDVHHAAPTPDHLLPLFYVAGIAQALGTPAELVHQSYAYGSLSMTSFAV